MNIHVYIDLNIASYLLHAGDKIGKEFGINMYIYNYIHLYMYICIYIYIHLYIYQYT